MSLNCVNKIGVIMLVTLCLLSLVLNFLWCPEVIMSAIWFLLGISSFIYVYVRYPTELHLRFKGSYARLVYVFVALAVMGPIGAGLAYCDYRKNKFGGWV